MKCLKCGWSNPDAATYCQKCHSYLSESSGMESLNSFKSLILGLFTLGVFYLIFPMPLIKNDYLQQLFAGRITEIIVFLVFWSVYLILFKFIQYRQQRQAYSTFRDQLLHDSLSKGIYIKDADKRILEISQFLQEQEVKKFQDSVIFRRVRRTLRHLKAIPKKEEITSILNYQAEIDYNRMQSSYALINVFIWAIPILGFIGTVFGIGQSIGEFSDFIRSSNVSDLNSQMRLALGGVTSGLSYAFSTTFVALIGVIPIMMLASSLRKREEDLLLSIEEYCLEELLPNLHLRHGEELLELTASGHLDQMAEFSENWFKQIAPLLESVEQRSKGLVAQVDGLQPFIQKFSEYFFGIKDKMENINQTEEKKKIANLSEKVEQSEDTNSSKKS